MSWRLGPSGVAPGGSSSDPPVGDDAPGRALSLAHGAAIIARAQDDAPRARHRHDLADVVRPYGDRAGHRTLKLDADARPGARDVQAHILDAVAQPQPATAPRDATALARAAAQDASGIPCSDA